MGPFFLARPERLTGSCTVSPAASVDRLRRSRIELPTAWFVVSPPIRKQLLSLIICCGARCIKCPTLHNDAELNHAELPQHAESRPLQRSAVADAISSTTHKMSISKHWNPGYASPLPARPPDRCRMIVPTH